MTHLEDGPLDPVVAKQKANAVIGDPKTHGQSADHAKSQKAEKLDDPQHQGDPKLDPKWSQVGDTWVHGDDG